MTTISKTLSIDTQGEWKSVATLASISFTSGNTYTMQIQNMAFLKIADAEFAIYDDNPFTYTASDDTLYIKTTYGSCILSVIENPSN